MATFDYADVVEDVKELLDEFGFISKLRHRDNSTTDKSIGQVVKSTPVYHNFRVVTLPVTEENLDNMDKKYLPNGTTLSDCVIVYAYPADGVDYVPQIGDDFDFGDGILWKIFSMTKIRPIMTDLLYVIGAYRK